MSAWIVFGAVGVACAAVAYKHWPRSRGAQYEHRLGELYAGMSARGLTATQQAEELAFRRGMAVLRRRASDAAVKNPTGPIRDMISSIAVETSKSMVDKDVARRFLKVVQDAPFSDILYKDAMRAIASAACRKSPAFDPTEDDIAAVTTR
jgi:hypothetical protein